MLVEFREVGIGGRFARSVPRWTAASARLCPLCSLQPRRAGRFGRFRLEKRPQRPLVSTVDLLKQARRAPCAAFVFRGPSTCVKSATSCTGFVPSAPIRVRYYSSLPMSLSAAAHRVEVREYERAPDAGTPSRASFVPLRSFANPVVGERGRVLRARWMGFEGSLGIDES